MERSPHKSSWKERKRKMDDAEPITAEHTIVSDIDVREKLLKLKKYIMICAVLAVAPVLLYFIIPGIFFVFTPFVNLIVVFIIVFLIYFPLSDLLKTPTK
ncbi:MAG: hypothetical protein EU536_00340 [Promethearchaeota archaeon]|nr:MAG: hypothetical protein EU536_00340 [Candidatus Lokiarchaeota archaeon]